MLAIVVDIPAIKGNAPQIPQPISPKKKSFKERFGLGTFGYSIGPVDSLKPCRKSSDPCCSPQNRHCVDMNPEADFSEMMVVKDKAVIVIDKKDWKKYEKKGYTHAEENETTDTGKKRAKVEINPSAEDSSD